MDTVVPKPRWFWFAHCKRFTVTKPRKNSTVATVGISTRFLITVITKFSSTKRGDSLLVGHMIWGVCYKETFVDSVVWVGPLTAQWLVFCLQSNLTGLDSMEAPMKVAGKFSDTQCCETEQPLKCKVIRELLVKWTRFKTPGPIFTE